MTKEYKVLKKRIDEIGENILEFLKSCKTNTSSSYQDLIKSYILLVHAELENYIETICQGIISKSKELYDSKQRITKPILSLATMSEKIFKEEDQQYNTTKKRLDKLFSNYNATLANNNGIKEKDLDKLLPIIGIEMEEVDDTLLSQLNAFGKTRGQIAHKTTKVIRDFKNEQKVVEALLTSLLDLDEKFDKLK